MLDQGLFPYGAFAETTLPPGAESEQFAAAVRFATTGWHSDALDDPPSTSWPPRILGEVEVAQSAFAGLGGGNVLSLTASEILISDTDDFAADMARFNTADGREIELRVAEVIAPRASDYGTPLRATARVWRGPVRRVERLAGRRARISLSDEVEALNVPLQPMRYAGTSGLAGGADLADRPLPVAIGQVFNVAPVALGLIDLGDGALLTYQTHWRGIVAHDVVRIRGVAQTAVGSAPGIGQFRDWPGLGVFQLGSSPDGSVTCDVRGEAAGYPSSIPQIVWAIASTLGPSLPEESRDATAWAFAEAALPGLVGFWQPAEDITALAAVQRLLAGCGAVLSGDRAGRLRLFDPFAVADTLQFDIAAARLVAEPEPLGLPDLLAPAPSRVEVEWGRNNAPIGDLAAAVGSAERQRLADFVAPVGSYTSRLIEARVARPRTLRLPGPYALPADAQARAEQIGAFLEGGARAVRVVTDDYLGAINLGDQGRVTYPGAGLEAGMTGTVIGLRERLGARRLEITLLSAEG